jgi:SAM-dependent methyltransferase
MGCELMAASPRKDRRRRDGPGGQPARVFEESLVPGSKKLCKKVRGTGRTRSGILRGRFDRCSSLGVSFCACHLPVRHPGNTTSVTPASSLAGVLAILVVQHLPHPAAFIAEIRRCLRPGGHLLITAPARDKTSLTSQNLYWRLRAACYQRVPGVVRFHDTNSLPRLVEDQGLTVVGCTAGRALQSRATTPAG